MSHTCQTRQFKSNCLTSNLTKHKKMGLWCNPSKISPFLYVLLNNLIFSLIPTIDSWWGYFFHLYLSSLPKWTMVSLKCMTYDPISKIGNMQVYQFTEYIHQLLHNWKQSYSLFTDIEQGTIKWDGWTRIHQNLWMIWNNQWRQGQKKARRFKPDNSVLTIWWFSDLWEQYWLLVTCRWKKSCLLQYLVWSFVAST